jgi:trehalose 6-phosphate phosphatase
MTYPPVPSLEPRQALFLDLDGTLVEFRDDPVAVHADSALRDVVAACSVRLGGALALVSGRRIADLDVSLAPHRFPAAGLHGLERRDAAGNNHGPQFPPDALARVRERIRATLPDDPGFSVEDKGHALAIHFRGAPEQSAAVRTIAEQILADVGPAYRLMEGSCVIELLPRQASKGNAVRAFMVEAPFKGRRPAFVGDDVTDLEGFQAARDMGGFGIAVGQRVDAEYRFADVTEVRHWLSAAVAHHEH